MKKCPTCDKTFEDSMRFCQIDGTPLVDDEPDFDPFATIVGVASTKQEGKSEKAAEPPFVPQPEEPEAIAEPDDVLEMPGDDPLKTMYASDEEMRSALKPDDVTSETGVVEIQPIGESGTTEEVLSQQEPPSDERSQPAPESEPSAPMRESTPVEEPAASVPEPEPPSFNVPNVPAPNFGDISPPPSPFSSGSAADRPVAAPSFEEQPSDSKSFNEAETVIQPGYPNPFDTPPAAAPVQEWTPPPAAAPSWENQQVASNAPFEPPSASAPAGQSQGLAIGSLVVGILSLVCCNWFVFGIAAIVMGFIAKGKADSNPAEYGGRGLALGGMITGAISVVLGILIWILYFFGALAGVLSNLN